VTRAEKDELFRKVDPARLDLPDIGRELLPLADYLDFPFDLVFSEGGVRYWLVEVEESDVGHASCNLAEGVTRADFVHVLDERALVYFVREFVGEPSGGAFSLNKPKAKLLIGLEKHRLVHDAVNPTNGCACGVSNSCTHGAVRWTRCERPSSGAGPRR